MESFIYFFSRSTNALLVKHYTVLLRIRRTASGIECADIRVMVAQYDGAVDENRMGDRPKLSVMPNTFISHRGHD